MLIFYVKIATEYLDSEADHEGIIKYLADLCYELRKNKVPLLILNNILFNVIVMQALPHRCQQGLGFVEQLINAL